MEPYLPEHMKHGMKLYLENGIEPGSFMMAVLCNDLREAVMRADYINLQALPNIVSYCLNCIPSNAWGSEEIVRKWMAHWKMQAEPSDDKNEKIKI